jgi:hypothetical protein
MLAPKLYEHLLLGLGVFVAVAPGVFVFPHYVGDPANPTNITLMQIAFVPLYISVSLFFKSRMPDSATPALLRFSVLSAAASLIAWAAIAMTGNALAWPVPGMVAPLFDFRGPNAVQAARFELWCEFWVVAFVVLYTGDWAWRMLTRSAPDPDRQ